MQKRTQRSVIRPAIRVESGTSKQQKGGNALSRLLARLRVGVDDLVHDLAHRLLQRPMRVRKVGRVILVVQPRLVQDIVERGISSASQDPRTKRRRKTDRLSVRNLLQSSHLPLGDDLHLTLDPTNPQLLVSRLVEHLCPVEAVEDLGRVLSCHVVVEEGGQAARVKFAKAREVVDVRVDDDPLRQADKKREQSSAEGYQGKRWEGRVPNARGRPPCCAAEQERSRVSQTSDRAEAERGGTDLCDLILCVVLGLVCHRCFVCL